MTKKQIIILIGFVIILISIPATMYLARQTQIFAPKAAFIPKIEFVDELGNPITQTATSFVKLRIVKEMATSSPFPSPTTSTTIDTLDYFLTDHPQQGLTGTHPFSQSVAGNKSYWVKWANDSFEIHSWDNNFIYLSEDHSNQDFGNGAKAYSFSNGKWLKRQMKAGEKIDVTDNKIQWYDGFCKKVNPLLDYPYTITLEEHISDLDLGGDLGKQDVIVLRYVYGADLEKFYYSKEWGWVKWQLFSASDDKTPKLESIFNKKLETKIEPNKQVACTGKG